MLVDYIAVLGAIAISLIFLAFGILRKNTASEAAGTDNTTVRFDAAYRDATLATVRTIDNTMLAIGSGEKVQFLIFTAPDQPFNMRLMLSLKAAQQTEKDWLEIVFVGSRHCSLQQHWNFIERFNLADFSYTLSDTLQQQFKPDPLPYGVVITGNGEIERIGALKSPSSIWRVRLLWKTGAWA